MITHTLNAYFNPVIRQAPRSLVHNGHSKSPVTNCRPWHAAPPRFGGGLGGGLGGGGGGRGVSVVLEELIA